MKSYTVDPYDTIVMSYVGRLSKGRESTTKYYSCVRITPVLLLCHSLPKVLHDMPPVGFEPTQFALVEVESTTLDQCAIEAAARNGRTSSYLLVCLLWGLEDLEMCSESIGSEKVSYGPCAHQETCESLAAVAKFLVIRFDRSHDERLEHYLSSFQQGAWLVDAIASCESRVTASACPGKKNLVNNRNTSPFFILNDAH